MSINHAILGMLSYKSLTGYDLKKIMQDSPFMYWSGNNNQIYKVLVELHGEGYVTNETLHRDSAPSKKVYTITAAGLAELKRWVMSYPEAPELRKSFLVQLAWTAQLKNSEVNYLLDQYEQELKGRLAILQKSRAADCFKPDRTPRETAVWDLLYDNIQSSCTGELDWVGKAKQVLLQFNDEDYGTGPAGKDENGEKEMEYQLIHRNGQKYIELGREGRPVQEEQDAIELLTICMENDTNLLLIHGDRLSDKFLDLKTGVAGAILQKFVLYNIKTAVIINIDRIKGKFKDFLAESNQGSMFRTYSDYNEAEQWLVMKNN